MKETHSKALTALRKRQARLKQIAKAARLAKKLGKQKQKAAGAAAPAKAPS